MIDVVRLTDLLKVRNIKKIWLFIVLVPSGTKRVIFLNYIYTYSEYKQVPVHTYNYEIV